RLGEGQADAVRVAAAGRGRDVERAAIIEPEIAILDGRSGGAAVARTAQTQEKISAERTAAPGGGILRSGRRPCDAIGTLLAGDQVAGADEAQPGVGEPRRAGAIFMGTAAFAGIIVEAGAIGQMDIVGAAARCDALESHAAEFGERFARHETRLGPGGGLLKRFNAHLNVEVPADFSVGISKLIAGV